jgi:hypothetical protein
MGLVSREKHTAEGRFFDGEKGKQWFPVNFPANPLNVSSRNCTCTMKRTGLKAGIDLRLGTTFGLLTQ